MTLVRWEPFRDLMAIQERMNRLLDGAARGADESYGAWAPPVDIFERGDDLVIRAELPGVEKEDIDVRAENGALVLQGERQEEREIEGRNAYRRERVLGRFHRSFTLPTTVDAGRISASYRNGILEVVLPKAVVHDNPDRQHKSEQ